MLAALLISIIANAFIVLRFSRAHFYKLHRYEGQLLYIKAIFIGSCFSLVLFLLDSFTGIIKYICKKIPTDTWQIGINQNHLEELFVFFCLTALLACIYCIIGEMWLFIKTLWWFGRSKSIPYLEKPKIILMYKILRDSPLDRLLFSSYAEGKFLLITMVDRKSYVGRVISLGEPNESEGPDQEIAIVPVYSGFRDKDTLSLTLTTTYDVDDIFIVLRQDNIISACEFIDSIYQKITEKKVIKLIK